MVTAVRHANPWSGGAGGASKGDCNEQRGQMEGAAAAWWGAGLAGTNTRATARLRLNKVVRMASTPQPIPRAGLARAQ